MLEWVCLGEATSRLLEVTGTHDRLGRLEEVDADAAHGVVPGYIALARVKQAKGNTEGALEALRKVEQVAQSSRLRSLWNDRAERCGEAWLARLWMAEGDLRAANRWAQDRTLSATDDPDYSSELEYITLARLLIAQGRNEEAEHLLGRLVEAAEAGSRGRTVTELLVLQALVLRARNDKPEALTTLRRAVTLAEPEGYIRTFADEGEPMADLLQQLYGAWRTEQPGEVPLDYIGKLLKALGAEVAVATGVPLRGREHPAGLTSREVEVLGLVAARMTSAQIAREL